MDLANKGLKTNNMKLKGLVTKVGMISATAISSPALRVCVTKHNSKCADAVKQEFLHRRGSYMHIAGHGTVDL